jgi:hypothetical protein
MAQVVEHLSSNFNGPKLNPQYTGEKPSSFLMKTNPQFPGSSLVLHDIPLPTIVHLFPSFPRAWEWSKAAEYWSQLSKGGRTNLQNRWALPTRGKRTKVSLPKAEKSSGFILHSPQVAWTQRARVARRGSKEGHTVTERDEGLKWGECGWMKRAQSKCVPRPYDLCPWPR